MYGVTLIVCTRINRVERLHQRVSMLRHSDLMPKARLASPWKRNFQANLLQVFFEVSEHLKHVTCIPDNTQLLFGR